MINHKGKYEIEYIYICITSNFAIQQKSTNNLNQLYVNKIKKKKKTQNEWNREIVQIFAMPSTVARQASVPMESSRQEYWSGLPLPSSGDLPIPGIEPRSPALQESSLPLSHLGSLIGICFFELNEINA